MLQYQAFYGSTERRVKIFLKLMSTQGSLKLESQFQRGQGMQRLVLRNFNCVKGEILLSFPSSPPCLLPYLQSSNGTAGCKVQVLGQVEITSKHGKMSCQKIVVLYSLKIKAVLMRIYGLNFFVKKTLLSTKR